jgi:hypothetical protein
MCGAGTDFDADKCRGDERAYAECLVDAGDCEPATAAECAAGAPGGDGDSAISLVVLSFEAVGGFLDLEVEIANLGEANPVPVSTQFFLLEDTAQNQRLPSGGVCHGGDFLAQGGSQTCSLQYSLSSDALAVSLVFREPAGRQATSPVGDADCPAGPESSAVACSDGCSNDGDDFADCDDFDCCEARSDCPQSSACGQAVCPSGPEDTFEACSDGCSNDDDSFVDCDDFDCCDVRFDCPPTTACGQ